MGFLFDIGAKVLQVATSCAKIVMTDRCTGQTLVEYAIILALISVVILFLLLTIGDSIRSIFNMIMNAFNNA